MNMPAASRRLMTWLAVDVVPKVEETRMNDV